MQVCHLLLYNQCYADCSRPATEMRLVNACGRRLTRFTLNDCINEHNDKPDSNDLITTNHFVSIGFYPSATASDRQALHDSVKW